MMEKQEQVSTGLKYQSPSDDPYSANTAMILKTELSSLEQYMENGDMAQSLLSNTETALMDINDSVQDIQTIIVGASTATMGETERYAYAEELAQIKENIMTVLNTTNAGRYIFGGYNTNNLPITNDGTNNLYNNQDLTAMTENEYDDWINEKIAINIGTGVQIEATMTALEVIGEGEDNLLGTIDKVIDLLKTEPFDDDAMEVQQGIMDEHFERVLYRLSEVGGKQKRLDMVYDSSEDRQLDLEELISKTEDVDLEEATIEFLMAEQAYTATLSSSADIIQPSLLDYLK
jgi:flagellar hook-associated protein 3 FlgL